MDRRDDMGLIHLDEDQCWRFLAKHVLGRVAFTHRRRPLVLPVNYTVDGDSVVFRSAPGTKLAAATTVRDVAFEVDEVDELFETGTSVVLHGLIREVTDPTDCERLSQFPLRTWAPGNRDHYLRIESGWITGRRIVPRIRDDGVVADGG